MTDFRRVTDQLSVAPQISTADLASAAGVPDGHGHNYGSAVLDGWVAIAAPEGWSQADTERVRAAMERYAPQDGPEK